MFVLLQVYPFDAVDHGDECCCLDVIAVDASKAEFEQYLVAYERRYRTAVALFDAWDDMSKDWGEEHDRKQEELQDRYQVYGSLIWETWFKIVEVEAGRNRGCDGPIERTSAGYNRIGKKRGTDDTKGTPRLRLRLPPRPATGPT